MNALSPATANIILWVVTGILIFALIILHLARCCKKPQWIVRKLKWLRTFYAWIGALAILGGTWAFFLPVAISSGFTKNDDGPTLRQLLIYTTGGILGVITLGETRRKNDQEHIRQVHAERRSRYATAIEQLADEKAPIRLGGVYTLVKLIDEWLADEKTLPNEEERREEGQVIVNSLCAYIRSPFDLASRAKVLSQDQTPENYEGRDQQFTKDPARFREEKELRLTILSEIKKRLTGGIRIHKDGAQEILKGLWSDFNYDFSNTVFFYPVSFSNSYFGASSNFSRVKFTKDADFSGVKFTGYADFSEAEFTRSNFYKAKFTQNADFYKAKFTGYANFTEAEFTRSNFYKAKFTGYANFTGAKFTGYADFSRTAFQTKPRFANIRRGKTYKARFSSKANPEDYNFEVSHDSPYKIETEEQEHNGVKFVIPKDAELFDPDKSSDLEDNEDS